MRNDHYPKEIIQPLLETDWVGNNTKLVLRNRLKTNPVEAPVFFEPETFYVLRSVCKQLIPQLDRSNPIDLAGMLDKQLSSGKGNGWRYSEMPADSSAYPLGIRGIEETSKIMFHANFTALSDSNKNKVLRSIQSGFAQGETWRQMSSILFFEELLASITELYYSHPMAKEEIGEVAFADAKGWDKIGLDQLDPQEPKNILE